MIDDTREARAREPWMPIAETPAPAPATLRALAVSTRVAAALVVLAGACGLAGWATGVEWLRAPIRGAASMMPNTAVMLILSGASLALSASATPSRARARAARALAIACAVIAGASLVEDLLGRSFRIDTLLFGEPAGRPPTPTSIALLFASGALLARDRRPRRGPALAEILALATTVPPALAIGGHLFRVAQFSVPSLHPNTGMAISTAFALVVLALGILTARPSTGMVAVVTSPLVGGRVVRTMLVIALAVPLLGYLAALGQRAGLYEPPGATVITTGAGMGVALLITLALGSSLNRADAERRRTEEETREWKRFFDRATFGAVFGTLDGKLGRVNEAFARMHGYTVDELAGAEIADMFPPHRRTETAEKIRVAHEQGGCRWESEHVRKDGSLFPVVIDTSSIHDEKGRLLYRATIIQDITREMESEAVRARLSALVQSAEDAIVAKTLDGIVLDWNHGAERVYGYTAAEMVGRSISIILPEDRGAEREAMRAKALRGETVVGSETERVRKDGARIPIALTLSPIRDAAGNVVGISTIERDISQRKQTEHDLAVVRERSLARAEELARSNADLRASLAEKEVLLKEVHHRVKNNLQVITSLLDLQATRVADAGSRTVLRESQSRVRAIALVHEKIYQSGELGSIDFDTYLQALVRSLVTMHGIEARAVAVEACSDGIRLGIDTAMHCGLIVTELVTNALKHAFPGRHAGRIQVTLRRKDDELILAVADDGIGLPAGLDFRCSPSLGLSLVCALTEQLGGTISLARAAGTTFAVRFARPEPKAS
jgi:PAS domain S-box-containing protein